VRGCLRSLGQRRRDTLRERVSRATGDGLDRAALRRTLYSGASRPPAGGRARLGRVSLPTTDHRSPLWAPCLRSLFLAGQAGRPGRPDAPSTGWMCSSPVRHTSLARKQSIGKAILGFRVSAFLRPAAPSTGSGNFGPVKVRRYLDSMACFQYQILSLRPNLIVQQQLKDDRLLEAVGSPNPSTWVHLNQRCASLPA
jgi:hypothetical protein